MVKMQYLINQPVSTLNYKNANYQELNKHFSGINWEEELYVTELDNSVSKVLQNCEKWCCLLIFY